MSYKLGNYKPIPTPLKCAKCGKICKGLSALKIHNASHSIKRKMLNEVSDD